MTDKCIQNSVSSAENNAIKQLLLVKYIILIAVHEHKKNLNIHIVKLCRPLSQLILQIVQQPYNFYFLHNNKENLS